MPHRMLCRPAAARSAARVLAPFAVVLLATSTASAQAPPPPAGWADDPPALQPLVEFARTQSELRPVVAAFSSGRAALRRSLGLAGPSGMQADGATAADPAVIDAQRHWYHDWLDRLHALDFDALSVEGRIDYILLRTRMEFELDALDVPEAAQRGGPIGADGLRAHLAHDMMPYSAEELLAIGEAEFEWLEAELLRAARDMGYGADWRAAQEAVKRLAVPPGQKAGLVRDLAYEAEAFVEARGSVTVPPLAREVWRMGMMSPERQLVSPFFLGGEQITISYPTDEMSHDDKLMSMRGNNPHFNRATVHHELIPGHHLQGFMTQRFNEHRQLFSTPFWGEGWALYWEFVLWDQDFPRSPEDRIGMLFWRMHRAARIIFSLSYHLGLMTEEEAVDFLVERVGHERANAAAEVRRSFEGNYSPLYQVGYMMGGMQFRSLRREFVDSGRMSEREFHDIILHGGRKPVEMVRARLTGGEGLTRDYTARWRFAGDPLGRPVAEAPTPHRTRPEGPAAPVPAVHVTRNDLPDAVRTQGDGEERDAVPGAALAVPELAPLLEAARAESDLRVVVQRWNADRGALARRYDIALSPVRHDRLAALHDAWLARLDGLDAALLNEAGRAELDELRRRIRGELDEIAHERRLFIDIQPLVPFARTIQRLQEDRRERLDVDPIIAAETLNEAAKEVRRMLAAARAEAPASEAAGRAADFLVRPGTQTPAGGTGTAGATLLSVLDSWYAYHVGYDPLFTWWVRRPYEEFTAALNEYAAVLRSTAGR